MEKVLIHMAIEVKEDIKGKTQIWDLAVIKGVQVKGFILIRIRDLIIPTEIPMETFFQSHTLGIDTRVTTISINLGLVVLFPLIVLNNVIIGRV